MRLRGAADGGVTSVVSMGTPSSRTLRTHLPRSRAVEPHGIYVLRDETIVAARSRCPNILQPPLQLLGWFAAVFDIGTLIGIICALIRIFSTLIGFSEPLDPAGTRRENRMPVQRRIGEAEHLCRGECLCHTPSPSADVAGVSPVPVLMWQG